MLSKLTKYVSLHSPGACSDVLCLSPMHSTRSLEWWGRTPGIALTVGYTPTSLRRTIPATFYEFTIYLPFHLQTFMILTSMRTGSFKGDRREEMLPCLTTPGSLVLGQWGNSSWKLETWVPGHTLSPKAPSSPSSRRTRFAAVGVTRYL